MRLPLYRLVLPLIAVCSTVSAALPNFEADSNDPSDTAQTPAPNDPQIVAIAAAANHVAIETGALARSQTHNQDLIQLARQIVIDHQNYTKQTSQLMSRLNLFPEENEISQNLIQSGETNLTSLRKLSGNAFDCAFLEQMISYQKQLLNTLDNALIPNARNADLKTFLIQVRFSSADQLQRLELARKKT